VRVTTWGSGGGAAFEAIFTVFFQKTRIFKAYFGLNFCLKRVFK